MPKAIHERSSIHGASQFMPFRAIHYGHARITYVNPSLSRVPIRLSPFFVKKTRPVRQGGKKVFFIYYQPAKSSHTRKSSKPALFEGITLFGSKYILKIVEDIKSNGRACEDVFFLNGKKIYNGFNVLFHNVQSPFHY